MRMRKSAVFSFSVTPPPAMPAFFIRLATVSASCHRIGRSAPASDTSSSSVISDDMLLASRSGSTGRSSSAAGAEMEPPADLAVARHQRALVEPRELADPRDAVPREPPPHRLADAPQQAHRLAGEERLRLGPAEHGEAARLVEVGGDLGPGTCCS